MSDVKPISQEILAILSGAAEERLFDKAFANAWKAPEGVQLKSLCVALLYNTIASSPEAGKATNEQCRAALAQIQSLFEAVVKSTAQIETDRRERPTQITR